MTSTPSAEALRLADAALDEIAPAGSVGEILDATTDADGILVLSYRSLLDGYPDWRWTVSMTTQVEGGPSVLETTLAPGETSLLAPEWVPWTDRLAEYLAAKEQAAAEETDAADDAADESDDDEDADDAEDADFDDFDEDDLAADDTDEDFAAGVEADDTADDVDASDDADDAGDAEPEAGGR